MSKNRRQRLRPGVRTRITYKQIIAATSGVFAIAAVVSFIYFGGQSEEARAAVNGDYRTVSSGSFATASNWQTFNGTSWVAAGSAPTSGNNVIEIQNGHVMSITANVTLDQVVIDAGGTLTVTSNTLTLAKGPGTDMQIDGTLNLFGTMVMNSNSRIDVNSSFVMKAGCTLTKNSGSVVYVFGTAKREGGTVPTVSSFWLVQTGGTFEHAMDGGTLPSATWSIGSTCLVSGVISNIPSGMSQTFKSFKWNCTGQTAAVNFNATLLNISENYTLASTGSSEIYMDQQGNNNTLNIGGNMYVTGGLTFLCVNGSTTINITGDLIVSGGTIGWNEAGGVAYGNTSATVNVKNVTVTGGTIDMSQCTANNSLKGNGIINMTGNLAVSGTGVITETSAASAGLLYFAGTTNQTAIVNNNITNTIHYTVNNGAILQMDNYVLTGTGNFTLLSGGGLWMGSAAGITQTGASGNIQSTGTRSYSTGADYTYNGLSAQVSGNGLPSLVHNLTLNNANNCTLTTSSNASGTLTFAAGLWIATNDTLSLGTSTANLGTLSRVTGHVVGNFRRWVNNIIASNILFPVGTLTYYNGANFSFTTAPTAGGTITANFIAAGFVTTLGLPLMDAGDNCINVGYGYWSLGAANGLNGGAWSVNMYANGFPAVLDYTKLHVFCRTNSSSSWTANGTHVAGTGSNASPVGNRTGMGALGQYGITSGSANPLPIELISFDAKKENQEVKLTWATATETNNDYFTLERSSDGNNFTSIGIVKGAGNSTIRIDYDFADHSPLPGLSFYRLRQTDYDGKTTVSDTKKINLNDDGMEHTIYIESVGPNPFDNDFEATYYSDRKGDVSIEIFNAEGKVFYKSYILSDEGTNKFNFTGGDKLPPGQYILRISHSGGVSVKKIIKRG